MYHYLFWHYTKGIKSFLMIWRNYLEFFWHYFSVRLLSRTLFYPWHRDVTIRGPGFDFKEFFQTLAFNLISRFLGAIVRLTTIIFALCIEIIALILGVFLFLVWLFFPLLILAILIEGFFYIFKSLIFALFLLLLAVIFILFWRICYYNGLRKSPSEMDIEEAMEQPWFSMVWERMGIDPAIGQELTAEQIPPVLEKYDLSKDDFNKAVQWAAREEEKRMSKKRFWSRKNLLAHKGIGKNWAYGYTLNLDKFSTELSDASAEKSAAHLVAREKEIESIERILSRAEENNVLLIGEPGVGKKTVAKAFAEFVCQGNVLPPLKHKRVLEFNLNEAMAGSLNASEMEARLRVVLNEAIKAGNIILVIDDFHNFIGQHSGLGQIDISGVLVSYLSSRHLQIIALTTSEGLHKYIETQPGILKFFEKVEIKEPDAKNTLLILEDVVGQFEARAQIRATYPAIKEIAEQSPRLFFGSPMPEKAIDLLEESMIYAATKTSDKYLLKRHVDFILSDKAKIPIGDISTEEKAKLSNLENILHQRVINQNEAIKEVSSAMQRTRAGVSDRQKPIGSFLFLGPTGVGKTETAKALAQFYFSDENKMIRLDMTEYQNVSDIYRLIGAPEHDPGYLAPKIRENPFSLLLLDEIEKTHPNILNLFLQVLDEGFLTDGWGRKLSFRNNIVIATSNAGAELIRKIVANGQDANSQKERILDYLQSSSIFKPEFLNRFDGIIIYHPLTKENLLKIAALQMDNLNKRLAEKKISIAVSQPLLEKIVELGYQPEYGTRAMKRVIQNKVENIISKKILAGEVKSGDVIEIKAEELQ